MSEENENWESILGKLIAYAFVLLDDNMGAIEKSELAKDFAVEAITKYLENKKKFDPRRNSNLIWYLKYNILRQLISNFHKSARNKREILINQEEGKEDFLENLYVKYIDYGNKMDAEIFLSNIEELIRNDDKLYFVFKSRYYLDSKKSEICQDLGISSNEYNNRMKRLKRLSKKVFKTYLDK